MEIVFEEKTQDHSPGAREDRACGAGQAGQLPHSPLVHQIHAPPANAPVWRQSQRSNHSMTANGKRSSPPTPPMRLLVLSLPNPRPVKWRKWGIEIKV